MYIQCQVMVWLCIVMPYVKKGTKVLTFGGVLPHAHVHVHSINACVRYYMRSEIECAGTMRKLK